MKSFFGTFLISAMVFVSSSVRAETLKVGPFQVHPYVKFRGIVDDNIYLQAEDKQESFITEISPGLDLKLLLKTHFLGLGCRFDLIKYSEEEEKNDAKKQNITLLADFNFPDKAYLKLKSVFRETSDPPIVELIERIQHEDTDIQAKIGFRTSKKVVCELQTNYNSYAYEEGYSDEYDRSETCISPVVFFHFLPRTSILGEINYGTIDYVTRSNSSDFFRFKVGLRKEMTPRFSLTIKGGGEVRTYEEETLEDFSVAVFTLEMVEKFSEYSLLSLFVESKPYESFYLNNAYFNSTRGFLKLRQNLSHKIIVSIGVGGYLNKYSQITTENNISEKRADSILEGTVGLDYKVQEWVSLGVGLRYRERDSNFDSYDYDNTQSSFNVSLAF